MKNRNLSGFEGIYNIVNESKVPTKLITLTYNNETVESYD